MVSAQEAVLTRDEEAALNADVIATMQAQAAPEPGPIKRQDVVSGTVENQEGDRIDVPMVVSHLRSAGYVRLYDRKSGEESLVNRNMLLRQLQKLGADGNPIFTIERPKKPAHRGTHKCMLHPGNPHRAEYDRMGFPTCPKANLLSEFMVSQHMRHRHHVEWETIEKIERDAREAEERAARLEILKMAAARAS